MLCETCVTVGTAVEASENLQTGPSGRWKDAEADMHCVRGIDQISIMKIGRPSNGIAAS